jgi:hypothetical protein
MLTSGMATCRSENSMVQNRAELLVVEEENFRDCNPVTMLSCPGPP